MTERIIKGRLFHIYNENVEFDRDNLANVNDICGSAALAMHKAIIGICELDSLENAASQCARSLKQAIAVQTYYIVYHLFTCCMLLDPDYKISFILKKDKIFYGTEQKFIKKKSHTPKDWKLRKYDESDLAVMISHGNIKDYCEELRGKRIDNRYLKKLYDYFIDENASCVLYEKIAYIRDRSIYRPTYVITDRGETFQTSLYVREQIDSLPKSIDLFSVIKDIHKCICDLAINNGCVKDNFLFTYLEKFNASTVTCSSEYAAKLGYSWEILEKMGGSELTKTVPSFLCQLMELESPEMAYVFYQKYWQPIIPDASDMLKDR